MKNTPVTYNSIVHSDLLAQQLHADAQLSEFYNECTTWLYWEFFYERIEYLDGVCIYLDIKPEMTV